MKWYFQDGVGATKPHATIFGIRRRTVIIIVVVVLLVVLTIGLAVGLTRRKQQRYVPDVWFLVLCGLVWDRG